KASEASPRTLEPGGAAQDARVVPHDLVERLANGVEVACRARERESRTRFGLRDGLRIGLPPTAVRASPRRHGIPRDRTEHGRIRHTVAAKAIRAVHAARVLARGEEPFERGAAIARELH